MWPLLLLHLFILTTVSLGAVIRPPAINPHVVESPCRYPMPFTKHFDMFCQLDYHMTPYMCDPTGLLSRTEAELLEHTVRSVNMTSCFCGVACPPGTKRLGIVIIPNATLSGLEFCSDSYDFSPPTSVPSIAFQYATMLSQHWSRHCVADIMLFYVRIWLTARTYKAYTIPIYANAMERLQRFSHPVAVSGNERVLKVLQHALISSKKIRIIEKNDYNSMASIPSWAKWTAAGMLGIVFCAVYIANCVTNRMGMAAVKQKPSIAGARRYSDRFRAGFGGGMMMNSSSQQKRGVMMFRTFQKTPRYGTTNNRAL